ncbi:cytidylyltransferase domain-containing protein, partial [Treponema pedis]
AIEFINSSAGNKKIKMVVRVTADNPFLFVQAASSSMRRYYELGEPDYFTYTGLPVGSGIEILKADTLLQRGKVSADSYEREHVGPSIYRHSDIYR